MAELKRSLLAELFDVCQCGFLSFPTVLWNWWLVFFFSSRFFRPFTEKPPCMNPGGIGRHLNSAVYGSGRGIVSGFHSPDPAFISLAFTAREINSSLASDGWLTAAEWVAVGGAGGLVSAGSRTYKDAHEEDLLDHISLLGRLWDEMGPQFCLSLAAPIDWSAANQC